MLTVLRRVQISWCRGLNWSRALPEGYMKGNFLAKGLPQTTAFKLLSCPAPPGGHHSLGWTVQTNVEEELAVSKTIYADCFSHWLRGQDAGSPGDLYSFSALLGAYTQCECFPSNLFQCSFPSNTEEENPGKGMYLRSVFWTSHFQVLVLCVVCKGEAQEQPLAGCTCRDKGESEVTF